MNFNNNAVQDIFLLYTGEGRSEKVTLGLTDTMYKKRLLTAGTMDKLSMNGFRAFAKACPGLLETATFDVDYIFMKHLGASNLKSSRFELTYEHFLDALGALAVAKYPLMEPDQAKQTFFDRQIIPLYVTKFGPLPASKPVSITSPGSTLGSSVSQRGSTRLSNQRVANVMLTSSGIVPAGATVSGPKVSVIVKDPDDTGRFSAGLQSPKLSVRIAPIAVMSSPEPAASSSEGQGWHQDDRAYGREEDDMAKVEQEFMERKETLAKLQSGLTAGTSSSDGSTELKLIVRDLVEGLERLKMENAALKAENEHLRALVRSNLTEQ